MEADALHDGADQIALAGFQIHVEEHGPRIRVFERAAVAVEPRGEHHAVGAGGDSLDDVLQIGVKRRVLRFHLFAFGHVVLLHVDAHLVQREVILDPFHALAGGFQLGKVVGGAVARAGDGGDHGGGVHQRLGRHHGGNPAGGAHIDVGLADGGRARAHADQRSVAAAAEHRNARGEAELLRRLRQQLAGLVGRFDDLRQVVDVDADHLAHLRAPALVLDVIQQRAERAVLRHDERAGHAADERLFDVEPLIDARKNVGLVVLDPVVFPDRILDRRRHRARDHQRRDQLEDVGAGNLNAVGHPLLELLARALVHIAHGTAHRLAVLVYQHKALRLRAEGNAVDLFRVEPGLFQNRLRGAAHGGPPLLGVLLGAAAGQHVELVALAFARDQADVFVDFEQAGLQARGADVIGQCVLHKISFLSGYFCGFSAALIKRRMFSMTNESFSKMSSPA